jgi:hypothetical protein
MCSSCLDDGKICQQGHTLKARFFGDNFMSYEKFSPWVTERKLPIQIPQRIPDEQE